MDDTLHSTPVYGSGFSFCKTPPHIQTLLYFLFLCHPYIHTHTRALQQLQQHLAALLTVNYLFSSCTFSCCHYSALYFPPCSLFFIFTTLLAGYLISSSHIPVVVARNSGRLRLKRCYWTTIELENYSLSNKKQSIINTHTHNQKKNSLWPPLIAMHDQNISEEHLHTSRQTVYGIIKKNLWTQLFYATSLFLALTSVTLAHCFRRYFFVSLVPPFNAFRDSHFNGEHHHFRTASCASACFARWNYLIGLFRSFALIVKFYKIFRSHTLTHTHTYTQTFTMVPRWSNMPSKTLSPHRSNSAAYFVMIPNAR